MFSHILKKKNVLLQLEKKIYMSTYPQFTNSYKICNNKVFRCTDILDECITIINKYIPPSKKNIIIYDICDKDIDLLLFYIYVIINCNQCNNNIYNCISIKKTLLCRNTSNEKFKKDTLIAQELSKYLDREYINLNTPLKLNRKTMIYTIRACNDKFMNLKE